MKPIDVAEQNLPDYYDVVSNPMDLQTILKKFNGLKYADLFDLIHDMHLIPLNSRKFFKKFHPICFAADIIYRGFLLHMEDIFSRVDEIRFIKPDVKFASLASSPCSCIDKRMGNLARFERILNRTVYDENTKWKD